MGKKPRPRRLAIVMVARMVTKSIVTIHRLVQVSREVAKALWPLYPFFDERAANAFSTDRTESPFDETNR